MPDADDCWLAPSTRLAYLRGLTICSISIADPAWPSCALRLVTAASSPLVVAAETLSEVAEISWAHLLMLLLAPIGSKAAAEQSFTARIVRARRSRAPQAILSERSMSQVSLGWSFNANQHPIQSPRRRRSINSAV